MFKLLVVAALVVACMAEPEADAWRSYGRYNSYNRGYSRGYGLWKRDADADADAGRLYGRYNSYNRGYNGYNRGYGLWKRDADTDADADADADPAVVYSAAFPYANFGYPYAGAYAHAGAYAGAYGFPAALSYNAYNYGMYNYNPYTAYAGIWKRDADAGVFRGYRGYRGYRAGYRYGRW